jgi:hypothetical protein
MVKNTQRRASETSPDPGMDVPEPKSPSHYEPSHVIQLLVTLQKEVVANATKMDRAISDLDKLDTKVSGLSSTLMWVKGFGAAALVLLPACAALIWWMVGDNFNQMKAQLLQQVREPPIVITPAPTKR